MSIPTATKEPPAYWPSQGDVTYPRPTAVMIGGRLRAGLVTASPAVFRHYVWTDWVLASYPENTSQHQPLPLDPRPTFAEYLAAALSQDPGGSK